MSKSTRKTCVEKPRPDFPLFPHDKHHPDRARWAKKVRGNLIYFGKVCEDPKGEAALQKWLDQRDDLLAGRKPRSKSDLLTVGDLINKWLDAKQARVNTAELSSRTWGEYKALGAVILSVVDRNRSAADMQPDDFATLRKVFAERWGPARLSTAVIVTRSIWRWAYEQGMIPIPQRFGSDFSRPSAKKLREVRNGHGPRMLTAEQIRAILDKADTNTRAMILLGINGGLGNTDVSLLPIAALDLDGGWLDYARAKTAIPRRIPLWPETVQALREVLAKRPKPQAGNEGLVFLNAAGGNYVSGRRGTAIWKAFSAAAAAAGVEGRTFYDLRRGFQTIADAAKDPVAVSAIMGHAPRSGDMSAVYRQGVSDDRLRAVVDVVRAWLFGAAAG